MHVKPTSRFPPRLHPKEVVGHRENITFLVSSERKLIMTFQSRAVRMSGPLWMQNMFSNLELCKVRRQKLCCHHDNPIPIPGGMLSVDIETLVKLASLFPTRLTEVDICSGFCGPLVDDQTASKGRIVHVAASPPTATAGADAGTAVVEASALLALDTLLPPPRPPRTR